MTKPASYTSAETAAALNARLPLGNFRAMICIFLRGAVDSHNMLVPFGAGNPNTALYEAVRASGVRIAQGELTSLGTSPAWALHPNLVHLRNRWDAGKLAVVRELGILNEPTTRTQYLANKSRYEPLGLSAHNIQQDAWQAGLPFRALRTTGWFGRTSSLIDDIYNPSRVTSSSTVSTGGQSIQATPYSPAAPLSLPLVLRNLQSLFGLTSAQREDINAQYDEITTTANVLATASPLGRHGARPNAIRESFREINGGYFDATVTASTNLATLSTDVSNIFTNAFTAISGLPDQGLMTQAQNAIRAIVSGTSSPAGFGHNRQMIYMEVGNAVATTNFDQHSSLRAVQDSKLRTLDFTIKALTDALTQLNLQNNVVIFTESDFGRTLRSNSNLGTDHAWAGHSFVVGGPVVGGLYGPEPDYTIGGGVSDASSLGRFIPRIATEQYYATLLRWFGIPDAQIPLVLPGLPLFSPRTLGFMGS
jgi:uncharacterized protein (DUF1501 family)